jgi:hypothetical protein
MIIPFITAIVLLLFFQHKTKWWELAIPLVVSAALCGGFAMWGEHSATRDSEFWGGWTTSAHYYEDWNEYIHKTCQRCVSTDKNGSCTSYMSYDCSYVSYHDERWAIKDSNGARHSVPRSTYNYLVKFFGVTPTFVDMRRRHHTNDGDMYRVIWPKTQATVEPVVVAHTYENRVQASRSVFSYVELSPKEVLAEGLFEYPEVSLFGYPSVLGDCGDSTAAGNKRLMYHNAKLGRSKQLRMWILCFQGGSLSKGHLQEAYWVGGNKNEVVLAIGTGKDGSGTWVHPFSWTDDKTPVIEIRDFIVGQEKLDLVKVADFMSTRLETGFVRKRFEEFSYLSVETPTWAIVTTFIVTLLVNIGLSYWLVNNEFHEGRV